MAVVILAGFVVDSRAARTGIKFGAAMRDSSGGAYDQKKPAIEVQAKTDFKTDMMCSYIGPSHTGDTHHMSPALARQNGPAECEGEI